MAFVKAAPSFPAITVAEKPSLLSSFNRFRRFAVQFATMRRFLRPRSCVRFHARLASGGMVRKAGPQRNHQAGPSSAASWLYRWSSCTSETAHMARSKQKQPKKVTAAEKQIGERIAAFRKMRGISQGALGEAVGVTFQQVQKYEKGTNRASAGRLQEIAGVLGVPLISFFDDVTGEDGPVPGEILSGLKQHGAADLLRGYTSIRSPELRRSLVQIARELAGTEGRALGPAIASAERRKGREARLA